MPKLAQLMSTGMVAVLRDPRVMASAVSCSFRTRYRLPFRQWMLAENGARTGTQLLGGCVPTGNPIYGAVGPSLELG